MLDGDDAADDDDDDDDDDGSADGDGDDGGHDDGGYSNGRDDAAHRCVPHMVSNNSSSQTEGTPPPIKRGGRVKRMLQCPSPRCYASSVIES